MCASSVMCALYSQVLDISVLISERRENLFLLRNWLCWCLVNFSFFHIFLYSCYFVQRYVYYILVESKK